MKTFLKNLGTRQAPQSEPILGAGQVRNSAGGHAWAVDDWVRLDRFLVLGGGRGLRQAVAGWDAQPADFLAYQAVKYQQRDGWSQRDLLRLAHPKATSEQHQAIYHWLTRGWEWVGDEPHPDQVLRQIWAFERA